MRWVLFAVRGSGAGAAFSASRHLRPISQPSRRPTALEIAPGNPGKRKLDPDESKPEAGVGDCPAWLDREGKACWAEHAPQLEAMGVLKGIDRQALMTFCEI